ncbi:MAG: mechanosensitive ion channel family protein [Bacteroidales bacterium]|nr:mechanosensitive ion channel family protein [Bacteroidales bacterium]
MELSQDTLIFIIVTAVMIALILIVRRLIQRAEKQRLKRLENVDAFEAVETRSPHRNKRKKAREIAFIGIAGRFTIIRRIIISLGIIIYLFIAILLFFDQIPVAIASLLASAAAIIIGIAAKPFIENIISGFVISFSDHFHTGDTVLIDGHYGTIEDISISHTIIKVWDWRRYLIPNSRMLQKDYINYSHPDQYNWAQIIFYVSYDTDIQKLEDMAVGIIKKNKYFAGHEKPRFWIMEMGEQSIECWLVAWAATPSDAWILKVDVRTELIKALQKEGIKTHFQNIQKWDAKAGENKLV